MTEDYKLYALELEPVEHPDAKWYVGITTNFERRLYEHTGGGGPPVWTMRNEVVDHAVIGEWSEPVAREFEDELTGLLMAEYGVQSTRGGRYTAPDLNSTPPLNPGGPSPELVGGLASASHSELAELGRRLKETGSGEFDRSDPPYIFQRDTVKDGREHVDLFAFPETETRESEVLDVLDNRFGDDLSKIDMREAIYRAGLRNLDDVSGELSDWGYE